MEHTLASTAALRIYEPSPPFMLVRFPPLLSKALDQLLSAPPGEQEPPTAIGVLGADLKVIHINPDLVASKSEASKKMPKQCAGESRVQTNTLGMEIICRIYDEGIYGARTTTNAVLFAKPPTYINFTWPVKYLKARLTPDPERPQSKLAKKTPSRAAALDNDNVFFKYFDQGVRTRMSAPDEIALQTIQNRLFLMLERKRSEGVNLKEAVMETGANPHIVRKMLDQIGRPFGAAGRTIWILQNQYTF